MPGECGQHSRARSEKGYFSNANILPAVERNSNWRFHFAGITATTPRDIKALGTTITRGLTLLQSGYSIVRYADARYMVANEKGDTYTIRYDEAQGVANCACEAYIRLGVCKHIVALFTNKKAIDAASAQPKPAFDVSDWNGSN
jgi:hypothetical protein